MNIFKKGTQLISSVICFLVVPFQTFQENIENTVLESGEEC